VPDWQSAVCRCLGCTAAVVLRSMWHANGAALQCCQQAQVGPNDGRSGSMHDSHLKGEFIRRHVHPQQEWHCLSGIQMFTYIMSRIDTFTPNKSAIAYFLPRVLGNYFLLGFSFLCCQESLLQPMLGGPALLCVSRCRLLRLFHPTCRMKRTPFCGNWHPCTSLGTTCTKPLSARQDVP
jgi:hypothetical protein